MATPQLSNQDWEMRLFIYHFFIEHARPPTDAEAAQHFGVSPDDARGTFRRLHDRHILFLTPDTASIRIANPLSAVETSYVVVADGYRLWANCAWDSLGIPAMLHTDARIEAKYGLGHMMLHRYWHCPLSNTRQTGAPRAAPLAATRGPEW